jgi:dipeptidyl-peptidase 4
MNKLKVLLILLAAASTSVGQKQITVEDFTTKNTFAQKTITGINWMNDGKFYTTLDDNKIIKYDITTGQVIETIVDGALLSTPLDIESYIFSADERKILLRTDFENIYRRYYTAAYYIFDVQAKSVQRLSKNGNQSYATFSPDGNKVGFVRDNNVFYVTLPGMEEVQVTDDGKFNHIINGTTDWVYEEEFSFVDGFYWSPDGKKIAYYRFDESEVKEYNLQKWNGGQLYWRAGKK